MKKILLSLSMLFSLTFGVTLEEGYEAFKNGEYKLAFTIFEELALNGNKKAQYNLGMMYYNGLGVRQSTMAFNEWNSKINSNKDKDQEFGNNLIFMYDKDYNKSIKLFEKIASMGDINAQFNFGIMYYNGIGVEQNFFKAKEWFEKACNNGNQSACIRYQTAKSYVDSNRINFKEKR